MNTLEKLFRKSVRGLAKQGFKQSLGVGKTCMYRGDDNRKCALGHLISNSAYSKNLEGAIPDVTVSGLDEAKRIVRACGIRASVPNSNFLLNLQDCHDGGKTPKEMKARLKEFAEENGFAVPKELE